LTVWLTFRTEAKLDGKSYPRWIDDPGVLDKIPAAAFSEIPLIVSQTQRGRKTSAGAIFTSASAAATTQSSNHDENLWQLENPDPLLKALSGNVAPGRAHRVNCDELRSPSTRLNLDIPFF
jgi:hypothetical protein